VSGAEMLRTFNMGVGMVAVVEPARAGALAALLRESGNEVFRLGEVIPGAGVTFTGAAG